MMYIKTTQNGKVKVDDEDYEYLKTYNWWFSDRDNYARTRLIPGTNQILMHRFIMNAPEGMEVDHIDGDRLNNQKSNLRLCTSSQNKCNRGARKDSKSGYKGVSWHKQNKNWTVRIKVPHGKYISLGSYDDVKEAAKAYNLKAKELHGDFAYINPL